MRPIQPSNSVLRRRHHLDQHAPYDPASFANQALWRSRALRESTAVRRAVRGARYATNGVLGRTRTLDALACGSVSELLMTPRFMEVEPAVAATAVAIAKAQHVRATTLSGAAALELDLIAHGVGALLRRRPAD